MPIKRFTLPSGATADLREACDITERHRRPIRHLRTQVARMTEFADALEKAQKAEAAGKKLSKADKDALADGLGEAMGPLEELNDRLCVAAVAGWSYDFPVTLDNLLDIPARDLDALREAVTPYMAELFPDFSPSKDKDSPTGV